MTEHIKMTLDYGPEAGVIWDELIAWLPELAIYKGNYGILYKEFKPTKDCYEITLFFKDNCSKADSMIDVDGRPGHNSRLDWEMSWCGPREEWSPENFNVSSYDDLEDCYNKTWDKWFGREKKVDKPQ